MQRNPSDIRDKTPLSLLAFIAYFLNIQDLIKFEMALGVTRSGDERAVAAKGKGEQIPEADRADSKATPATFSKRVQPIVFRPCWDVFASKQLKPHIGSKIKHPYFALKQAAIAPEHFNSLYHFAVGDMNHFSSVGNVQSWIINVMTSGESLQLIPGENSSVVFDSVIKPFFCDQNGENPNYKKNFEEKRKYTLSHLAAYFGQAGLIVDEFKDANDAAGCTPLMMAVSGRQLTCINALLKVNANVNAQCQLGDTVLHKVAKTKLVDTTIVKMLVEKKANIEAINTIGHTPLYEASLKASNAHTIRALVQANANIHASNKKNNTALFAAFSKKSSANAAVLLNAGLTKITGSINKNRGTALYWAIINNDSVNLQTLLSNKANINVNFKPGDTENPKDLHFQDCTALHVAVKLAIVSTSRLSILKTLLDNNADLNAVGATRSYEFTALSLAIESKDSHIVKALADAKADVNFKVKDGITPLRHAARKGDAASMQVLIEAKADIQNKHMGSTILQDLAIRNNTACLKVMLEAKANINATDIDGHTALCAAVIHDNIAQVQALIDAKCDVNVKNKMGQTALHLSASFWKDGIKITKMLIDANANVDAKDRDQRTPSMLAGVNIREYFK